MSAVKWLELSSHMWELWIGLCGGRQDKQIFGDEIAIESFSESCDTV